MNELISGCIRRVSVRWQSVCPQLPRGVQSTREIRSRTLPDLVGVVTSYDETVAFLDSKEPDKWGKLIDRLLASHQAETWDIVLFGRIPPGCDTHRREVFQAWLRWRFEKNVPYDQWARDLLEAEGTSADNGSLYFAQWRNAPEDAIEAVPQTFLGVRLQCVRCHDHPFEEWKQREFYGMVTFLARLDVMTVAQKGNAAVYAIGERNSGEVRFTRSVKDAKPDDKAVPSSDSTTDVPSLAGAVNWKERGPFAVNDRGVKYARATLARSATDRRSTARF